MRRLLWAVLFLLIGCDASPQNALHGKEPPDDDAIGMIDEETGEDETLPDLELLPPDKDLYPKENPRMLADLVPGEKECTRLNTVVQDGRLFVACEEPEENLRLWYTPEPGGEQLQELYFWEGVDDALLIPATHGLFIHLGKQLWFFSSESSEFALLHSFVDEIYPVNTVLAIDRMLYFQGGATFSDNELWRSDGTTEGTVKIRDLTPGTTGSGERYLAFWRGEETARGRHEFYFIVYALRGRMLYRSDGTEAGTLPIPGVLPNDPGRAYIGSHFRLGDRDYFFSGSYPDTSAGGGGGLFPQRSDLFSTDLTPDGTVLQMTWGAQGSENTLVYRYLCNTPTRAYIAVHQLRFETGYYPGAPIPPTAVLVNDTIYAVEASGEIFSVASGTVPLSGAVCDADAGRLYFLKEDYFLDYVPDGERRWYEFSRGSIAILPIGDRVLTANDYLSYEIGRELFIVDVEKSSHHDIADLCLGPCGSSPGDFSRYRDGVLFRADKTLFGRELWFYDPTRPITEPWLFVP